MGDIGEETHVHGIHTLLLLLLYLCLTSSTTGCHHTTGVAVEVIGEGSGEGDIDEPGPPRIDGCRFHHHPDGALCAARLVVGIVGRTYTEGIVPRRQIGIAGCMVVAAINPVTVEAVHLVVIVHALILPEVEGRIGDGETVLVVLQADFFAAVEHGVDGAVGRRAHQLVVDLQVAEADGCLSQRVDIGRVEHRDTLCAAEDEAAVGQLAGGTVRELVAADAVGLIERGDAPRLTVPAVQSLHRTDPEITLMTLLDARHVRAGEACDARHLVGLGVIAQQTVAHGTDPHVALLILVHVGGDIHAATDALGHRRDVELAEFASLRVQAHDLLVEGGDEHLSVVQFQQRGDEAEVGIERLLDDRLRLSQGEAYDVVRTGRGPHGTVVRLLEVHRGEHGPLAEDGEAPAVIAALHHHTGRGEPQQSVAVAEDMGDGILLFACRQPFQGDEFRLLGVQMIHVQSLEQGGYPEVLLTVCGHGEHAGVVDHTVQVVVRTTELLLIVVVSEETLVVGAQPDVLS